MTVAELEARLSASELKDWFAFDQIEPLPSPWDQTGLLCAVMANTVPRKELAKPGDFIPIHWKPPEKPPVDQTRAFFSLGAQLCGAGHGRFANGNQSGPFGKPDKSGTENPEKGPE